MRLAAATVLAILLEAGTCFAAERHSTRDGDGFTVERDAAPVMGTMLALLAANGDISPEQLRSTMQAAPSGATVPHSSRTVVETTRYNCRVNVSLVPDPILDRVCSGRAEVLRLSIFPAEWAEGCYSLDRLQADVKAYGLVESDETRRFREGWPGHFPLTSLYRVVSGPRAVVVIEAADPRPQPAFCLMSAYMAPRG